MGNVVFDSFNDTVLNVYYLVGLVGNSAFVCDDYDGHPRPVQVFQYLHHFYGGLTVQCSCGLVRQNNLRSGDECAGDGYTLFLSAAHLVRHMMRPILQSQTVEVFQSKGIALFTAYSLIE